MVQQASKSPKSADSSRIVERPSPTSNDIPSDEFRELKGYQRAMFKSMTVANTIPQLIFSDEVDMTQLVRVRQILKKAYGSERNVGCELFLNSKDAFSLSLQLRERKWNSICSSLLCSLQITYMPILLKSLSMALLEYPVANSEASVRAEEEGSRVGVLLKGICRYTHTRIRL